MEQIASYHIHGHTSNKLVTFGNELIKFDCTIHSNALSNRWVLVAWIEQNEQEEKNTHTTENETSFTAMTFCGIIFINFV